ncbi:MAG: hypothetical protein HYT80_06130 [Euryarchaeota archaeon]|nr:hypothetical protein [Euryarchaeota archaeon]
MRDRFHERLELLPEERRRMVLDEAERLIHDGVDEDRALFEALREEFARHRPPSPTGPAHGSAPGPPRRPEDAPDVPGPRPQAGRVRGRITSPAQRPPKRARASWERRRRG